MSFLIRILYIFICLLISSGEINANVLMDSVKIGLLIPDKNSKSALNGAEMAIRKANAEGGFNGKPFELIVRSLEGPWGTGSNQAVDLIFKENVCAIVGSCDGKNGHLIEQATTKGRIVFLSAWATDPTLSQAFVPWYFSCVPNDMQQADELINEIYIKRKITRVAILADNKFDSGKTLENIVKKIKLSGNPEPVKIFFNENNPEKVIDQIEKAGVDGLILTGEQASFTSFINFIEGSDKKYLLFGTLSLLGEDYDSNEKPGFAGMIRIVSTNEKTDLTFEDEYKKQYGSCPGMIAELSFDAMTTLIKAIKKTGTDRSDIQKSLTKIRFEGITGPIKFDDKGNRIGTLVIRIPAID